MKILITYSIWILLIITGFIFNIKLLSIVFILMFFIIQILALVVDGTFSPFLYPFCKKIHTEYGIFYTFISNKNLYIVKDVYLFFKYVEKININYNNLTTHESLKKHILSSISNSNYLSSKKDEIIEKKKIKEVKKALNSWSGFTSKDLERDFKIKKII